MVRQGLRKRWLLFGLALFLGWSGVESAQATDSRTLTTTTQNQSIVKNSNGCAPPYSPGVCQGTLVGSGTGGRGHHSNQRGFDEFQQLPDSDGDSHH